ncbi:MAG: hypothetical protein DRQ62_00060 [Gammaproteobacteria bacterium]|nr:MAG: hypothetical protein DRQ62_00060 [Gammaproteobacteria bacterium]
MKSIIQKHLKSSVANIDELVKELEPYNKLSELPLEHFHGDNLYVRYAMYPKGAVVIGRVHKFNHVFVLMSGEATIWTRDGKNRVKAPAIIETKAGTQRVGYFHANSMCLNCHGHESNEDISEPEKFFTTETEKEYNDYLKLQNDYVSVEDTNLDSGLESV